jgi:thymidylate synthase
MMKFDIIVAINSQTLIGIKEYGKFSLPWPNISGDMKRFRDLTTTDNCAVIIGFNTWISLPLIYKNNNKRKNIVICRNSKDQIEKFNEIYVETFESAISTAERIEGISKIFVIGGSKIFCDALKHSSLNKIYLTYIKSFFPLNEVKIDYGIRFPLLYTNLIQLEEIGDIRNLETIYEYDSNTNIYYTFKTLEIMNNKILKSVVCENNRIYYSPKIVEGDFQYQNLIKEIMANGILKMGRNGFTKSIFGYQLSYDLSKGFPISTEKRCYPKSIFLELMWMLRGQTDVRILQKQGVHIWDKNSSEEFLRERNLPYREGDIGPGYGFQLRHFGANYIDCETDYTNQGFDQLEYCIKAIQDSSDFVSRRIIINLWNCSDIDKMALPPCHYCYTFGVDLYETLKNGKRGKLNCHLIQRSWDVLLGWNTSTAALLTHLLANHCDLDVGILVHSITDAHLYKEHIDSGKIHELLSRTPRKFPTLRILNKRENITDHEYSDIQIENYFPCPAISAEMKA